MRYREVLAVGLSEQDWSKLNGMCQMEIREVRSWNTGAGFGEYLESKGIKSKKKRIEITDRLIREGIIQLKDGWRFRYEVESNVGIFYLEKEKDGKRS